MVTGSTFKIHAIWIMSVTAVATYARFCTAFIGSSFEDRNCPQDGIAIEKPRDVSLSL